MSRGGKVIPQGPPMFGTAVVDRIQFFEVTSIELAKGCVVFNMIKRRCTITLGPTCDISIFGMDGTRVASLRSHPISSQPMSTTDGDFYIDLPISLDKITSASTTKRGGDGSKREDKERHIFPFNDAIVGNKAYTYEQAEGLVYGDYGWVTTLDYFDERSDEVTLIRKKWLLLEVEELTLPSPFDDTESQ